jgi:hypothetical protein
MLRWFPTSQVATTSFSCSPPDLNLVVTNFTFCIYVKQPLPPGINTIAVNSNNNNNNNNNIIIIIFITMVQAISLLSVQLIFLGSNPVQFWWTKWKWNGFNSEHVGFPPVLPFHRLSELIRPSDRDVVSI